MGSTSEGQEGNLHIRLDDVSPSIVKGEIGNQNVEEDLEFVDREPHPNAGLYRWEMRHARDKERPTLLTLGPAENVIRFEYKPGCSFTAAGRLSQRSGLYPPKLRRTVSETKKTAVLELPCIWSPNELI